MPTIEQPEGPAEPRPTGSDRQAAARARSEKVEALRRAEQRTSRRRIGFVAGVGGIVVASLVGVVAFAVAKESGSKESNVALDGVATYTHEAKHVTTPVAYEQTPPAGGPHSPAWLNCGQYSQPVPGENAVHSMEHGAVWITYRPDLAPDLVESLKDTVPKTFGVLSPFPDLPAPVVASAWGRQLKLEDPKDPRLGAFVKEFRLGKQAPEPGAPCDGGVGPDGQPSRS
ncbi:MAG: DUF3105 domain-containing protein [Sporichthyaceae bacterium]